MYKKLGYQVYRTVLEYYSGGERDEDAFGKYEYIQMVSFGINFTCFSDMRKALPRDKHKTSIIPLPHPVRLDELEW